MADTLKLDHPHIRNPHLQTVKPHFAQHDVFMPVEGGFLNVTLPGEQVRAVVDTIHSPDVVTAKLAGTIFNGRLHGYKKDQVIAVTRDRQDTGVGELGAEIWRPITETETAERERAIRMAEAAVAEQTGKKPKRKARA